MILIWSPFNIKIEMYNKCMSNFIIYNEITWANTSTSGLKHNNFKKSKDMQL